MNTYFSGISAVAVGGSHAALGTVTAPTVTVTAQGNVVKVISAPQLQQHLHLHQHQPQVTKVANQLGSHGVPNTSISSSSSIKRSRISVMTKEKEVIKKPLYVTSSELMGACSALAKKEISLEAGWSTLEINGVFIEKINKVEIWKWKIMEMECLFSFRFNEHDARIWRRV